MIDIYNTTNMQGKSGKERLCVEIDELTPCLTDNESGEIVETEVIRIKRKSFLSKYNKDTGWYVKWSDLLEENEIYAIVVKGTVSIQGLVAVRPDYTMKTSFVTWMVAAPCNNPEKVDSKNTMLLADTCLR